MYKHFWAAVVHVMVVTAAYAEKIPSSDFSYQNWQGAAYTFEGATNFSHCVISATYLSGDVLFLSVNAGGTVGVGVLSNNLNLAVGQSFPVTLRVDRNEPIYATATAATSNFASLNIPNFDLALTQLKKGRGLSVASAVGQASFDLTGTFHALDAAKECAFRNMSFNAGSTPIASAAILDKTILFQVATQMISDLKLVDFRYMTQQEGYDKFQADGVFWTSTSNGILGGVAAVSKGTILTLAETDGSDVAFLSKRCSGDLATSFRAIPSTDVLIREIRSICAIDGTTTESYMTKALIGDNVVYTILIFEGLSSPSETIPRNEVNANVAVKTASFILSSQLKN